MEGEASAMKTYTVTIMERLEQTVEVQAASALEARDLVERQWRNSDHILDSDHFVGVDFKARPKQKERVV
jgi:hypothetical protein